MKKRCAITGMIAGILMMLIGFLTLVGFFGVADNYPSYAPTRYDSGFAMFGGDYYNYSANNSAEAASGAQAAAKNIMQMSEWLQGCMGTFLICMGLAITCAFGIVVGGVKEAEKAAKEAEEANTADNEEKTADTSAEA